MTTQTRSTSRAIHSLVLTVAIVAFALIGLPARVAAQTTQLVPCVVINTVGCTVMKSVEFTRPANTTAYAAGDLVGPATKTITAASNTTPIVVTATAHGYATDDRVTIASVGGNTNANGTWKIRVLTANTFSIYNESTGAAIAGNAAYTSGGTAQKLLRLADVLSIPGGGARLVSARLITDNATVTNGVFRIRLYNLPITQVADNAAFTLLYANRAKEVLDYALTIIITEGSGSDASAVTVGLSPGLPFAAATNRTDLFVQLTATAAFTPGSAENFRLELTFTRDYIRGNY